MPIINGYGLSETAAGVTFYDGFYNKSNKNALEKVGYPLPGT